MISPQHLTTAPVRKKPRRPKPAATAVRAICWGGWYAFEGRTIPGRPLNFPETFREMYNALRHVTVAPIGKKFRRRNPAVAAVV
jgi:hypothetical protein